MMEEDYDLHWHCTNGRQHRLKRIIGIVVCGVIILAGIIALNAILGLL